jgi:hypothetical protein
VLATTVDAGVVPGSYRLVAQDARGRQIEATAGAPGRIAGSVQCPVTLIAQAQVVSTSISGAQGELRVGDVRAQGAHAPEPRGTPMETSALYRFDLLVERPVEATRMKQAAEFDVRYAEGDATHLFRWPVVLDLECISTTRKPQ